MAPHHSIKKFPLKALLILYGKSNKYETYCNYFEGFKLLVDWLGPIDIPEVEPAGVAWCFGSYEIQEMAVILGCSQYTLLSVCLELFPDLKRNKQYERG